MGDRGRSQQRTSAGQNTTFTQFKRLFSAPTSSPRVSILEAVKDMHSSEHVTAIGDISCNLIKFAEAGHAKAALRRHGKHFSSHRTYSPPRTRMESGDGNIDEDIAFGLFDYSFDGHDLLVYSVEWENDCGVERVQYIITPQTNEDHCAVATKLIAAAGKWSAELHKEVYVFDGGDWNKSSLLWESVQSASWDDVILDPAMKEGIISDVHSFFDNRSMYEAFSVQWKRGVIFHGHPGCGKTITIKALMKSLQQRGVASLYVKSFKARRGAQYSIREIFERARTMAPCLLIFEDLDSLVGDKVRSYFLNEVDGLEKNDGILMIGSTNHLERLDAGISKRPSRFDRKYLFKLPDEKERVLYCEYWMRKLRGKMEFHQDICQVVAQLTDGFSFAYLQELFVQTLLCIVGGRANIDEEEIQLQKGINDDNQPRVAKDGKSSKKKQKKSKKLQRAMPIVEIPQHLKSNPLMSMLDRQAKALWQDMDSMEEDINRRSKVGGGGEDYDDSEESNSEEECASD